MAIAYTNFSYFASRSSLINHNLTITYNLKLTHFCCFLNQTYIIIDILILSIFLRLALYKRYGNAYQSQNIGFRDHYYEFI